MNTGLPLKYNHINTLGSSAMSWRIDQAASRSRYLRKYDQQGALEYDQFVGTLSEEDEIAYANDLREILPVRSFARVLDVGAGTGAFSQIMLRMGATDLTVMEPSPSMLERLRLKPKLSSVSITQGFCDTPSDAGFFAEKSFDLIASRQVVNGLYDPLAAFRNWYHWLTDNGVLLVVDGIYGRDGWKGIWEEEVDTLPHSACQSLAMIPYLLEQVGFKIEKVQWMPETNQLASTRTKRYAICATKS